MADELLVGSIIYINQYSLWSRMLYMFFFNFNNLIFLAIEDGKYDNARLYNGQDFRMQTCGKDARNSRPYTYYLAPEKDINIALCVEECPVLTGLIICLYKSNKDKNDTVELTEEKFCNSTLKSFKFGKYCIPK